MFGIYLPCCRVTRILLLSAERAAGLPACSTDRFEEMIRTRSQVEPVADRHVGFFPGLRAGGGGAPALQAPSLRTRPSRVRLLPQQQTIKLPTDRYMRRDCVSGLASHSGTRP